ETRILAEVRPFDGRHHAGPVAILLEPDEVEASAVAGAVRVQQRRRELLASPGRLDPPEPQEDAEVPSHRVDAGAQERGPDEAALPGALPLEEGGHDAGHGGDAGDMVAHAAADVRWHLALRHESGRHRRPGPEGANVVAGPVTLRSFEPVPGD